MPSISQTCIVLERWEINPIMWYTVYDIRYIIGITRMRVRFTPQSMTAATEVRCKRVRIRASMRQIHLWSWRPKRSHRRFALVAFICSMKGTWTRTQHSRTHRRGKEMGGVYNAWEILVCSWHLPSQSMMIKWWYLPGEWRVEWRRRFSYCPACCCHVRSWRCGPPEPSESLHHHVLGLLPQKDLLSQPGPSKDLVPADPRWRQMLQQNLKAKSCVDSYWFILFDSLCHVMPRHKLFQSIFQKA